MDINDEETNGERLQRLRKRAGLTQLEVAIRLSVPRQVIVSLEADAIPTVEQYEAVLNGGTDGDDTDNNE